MFNDIVVYSVVTFSFSICMVNIVVSTSAVVTSSVIYETFINIKLLYRVNVSI